MNEAELAEKVKKLKQELASIYEEMIKLWQDRAFTDLPTAAYELAIEQLECVYVLLKHMQEKIENLIKQ